MALFWFLFFETEFHVSKAGISGVCHHTQFILVLGIEPRVFCMPGRHYLLSPHPQLLVSHLGWQGQQVFGTEEII